MTNEEMFRQLGLNIAHYRRLRHLTQQELADQVGISRGYLGHIEAPNIETSFSIDLLFLFARVLDVEPKCFFDFR